jgi:hypothetical protein
VRRALFPICVIWIEKQADSSKDVLRDGADTAFPIFCFHSHGFISWQFGRDLTAGGAIRVS